MKFEWDETKRDANIAKHKIDFELAKEVFVDVNRVEFVDNRINYGEERRINIGSTKDGVLILTVVCVDRLGAIRIVSARCANRKEKELYYG
jgi:hypothetical protein